jgi:hypothetical protein
LKKKFLEQYALNQLNSIESKNQALKVLDKRIDDDLFKINFNDYELNANELNDDDEEKDNENDDFMIANYDVSILNHLSGYLCDYCLILG